MPGLSRPAPFLLHLALLALLLFAPLCEHLGSQLQAAPRSLRFERLGSDSGLTQQSVLNILQDRYGFIWFGTQAGLHRYDGYRMTVYQNDPNDPGSLPDNYVLASFQDARGVLWFGTKGGLARFDPATGRFAHHPLAEPGRLARRGVTAIVQAPAGALWLGTTEGLVQFDPATGRHRSWGHDPQHGATLRDDRINALAVDAGGALWIGTTSGLDRMAPGAPGLEHIDTGSQGDSARSTVLALSMGSNDTLWVGTGAGLDAWRVDGVTPRRVPLRQSERLMQSRILRLYHDSRDELWVGTDADGLQWHDAANGRFTGYRHAPLDQHSLSDNQVTAILVDRTGTLWAGTYFGGVSRSDLASGGFERIGEAEGMGRAKVRAVQGDATGRIWIGTTGDGLLYIDPVTRALQRVHSPALQGDVVTALAAGRSGDRLWIGTPTGLLWRDARGRFGRVPLGAGAAASYVQALRLGRDGTLWIATRGGLAALAPGAQRARSWRNDPDDPSSLGDDYTIALLEDRHGALWIGTESGLDRFDRAGNTFTHYRHDPQDATTLRHSRVYNLLESRAGDLWVGTAGGLHRMLAAQGQQRAQFRFYPFARERPAPPIGVVLEDREGLLWASTTAGITRLDPATGKSKNYTAKHGLTDGAYFVGSGWRGPDGRLHFGGMHGMTSFLPLDVRDNPFPASVAITDLLVLNRSLGLADLPARRALTLSHHDSMFTIEFAALHFADPRANRYAYRLDGFDEGWVESGAGRRFATYTNLDPGTYVFRVRASNKDGVWGQEAPPLAITITPPFWKTWWLRLLVLAGVLGISYLFYRMRVRALVQQKELLEREVGARTGELRLQKESLERQKESIERAHRNIALLSDMGRTLTANLDHEAIMATLYRHVQALMEARTFAVALARPARGKLDVPFVMLDGARAAPFELALAPASHVLAASALEGREFLLGDASSEADLPAGLTLDGAAAAPPCSLLCVPVTVGERMLGAVTVQSVEFGVYSQVHLDMLGTLAAYVGVAIDNAAAYHQLKETQAQLAAHEKLASLGSMVAGVAHELNTPIGNSLLMASSLQERAREVAQHVEAATLKRSDLQDYMAASLEASALIMRSLHNAAELVSSFRQVSVDQVSDQRRSYDLARACHEIAATMMNTVRCGGHGFELDVPEGITMDGYPGPLGQVIINFVNNAMLHAFEAPGGVMRLRAVLNPGHDTVELTFSDNGRGIEADHLGRIFDPFFTTRMGQGGTGLGLNITYTIVTTLLGGTIRVDSAPGSGAAFVLTLPLVAP